MKFFKLNLLLIEGKARSKKKVEIKTFLPFSSVIERELVKS